MGIPENIDALLVKYDITAEALARIADVAPSSVHGWRHGSTPRNDAIDRVTEYFNIERDDILSDRYGFAAKEHGFFPKDAKFIKGTSAFLPVHGSVHAGKPTDEETVDDLIEVPQHVADSNPDSVVLRVEGDCMNKVIPEGCHIIVNRDRHPQNGDIAAFEDENYQAVVRRYFKGANTLILSPDSFNTEHKDIVLDEDSERTITLIGTVVWFQSNKEIG